ncbi:Nramp family divalent metal transporter [Psychroflexus planctonicus]|uniref:Transporter n=1 Tax=Psychroflexus planctonicus TaxID=1526575 RepID=A0ABQ1SMU0_9FLAO|nr:Nramp family divalent metal transporter [Psychroflexus planctonicus]GGE43274.1 transporter [Psychroflexus planctonicus]
MRLSQNIGPGFLLAGAAIGVSHLVQSTRAGAEYGWVLIFALLIACISKYPFLMMGPKYTAATGKNLIEGYKSLGKFQYYTYIGITVGTMFIILAAVTLVTGGLAAYFFPLGISLSIWCLILLCICFGILLFGRYNTLDKGMKIIITLLTLLTFFAVVIAAVKIESAPYAVEIPSLTTASSIAFIVAFMGWMPIPIDASIWHSIWTKEKSILTGKATTADDTMWDFNIGYVAASVIGILFFMLGVLVMFGNGLEFSKSSVTFSAQLIDLYAQTLGNWTENFIAFAAFITMFSTTLSVADAYPRVISEIISIEKAVTKKQKFNIYLICLFLVSSFAFGIIHFGSNQFTVLVDFATGLSFLAAPFLAWFNYQLFQQKNIPKDFKFNKAFKIFSIVCLVGLVVFNFVYLWTVFFL